MNKRKMMIFIVAIILVSIVSGVLGGVVVLAAWPFSDVNPGDWFYNDVQWLDSNGITTGYADGTYRPNNNVIRSEMAAFLHREAGALVAAGVHIKRGAGNAPYVADWFNNVNGVAPTISGAGGSYDINVGFTATDRFVMCAVDTNYVDTRDAFCTTSAPGGNTARVRIYDISAGGEAPAEFWLLVYGQ